MQPIKIWQGTPGTGPNPWKPILVLAELDIPYEIVWIKYAEAKREPYLTLNPNGRLPAMLDPNNGVMLFESGAIINYLVDVYDKEKLLTYGDDQLAEKYLIQSWLMFQMSGQGPMFGQKMWFTHFHVEENLSSALNRYAAETRRICTVIDNALALQRKKLGVDKDQPVWLVGDKCTYADLSFVPWNKLLFGAMFLDVDISAELAKSCPEFFAWNQNLLDRPAVKKTLEKRDESIKTLEDSAAASLKNQADFRKQ